MTDFSNNTAGRTQLLISLVKEYPALYDPAHVDYRDTKVTRPKIWAEITNKVEEQYPPLPNETPCPERWRSLRDRFTAVKRTMLRNRRSEFKMTTPSWPYWENMQWYSRYCPKLTRRKASFTIKRSPSSPVMDDSLPPLSLSPHPQRSFRVFLHLPLLLLLVNPLNIQIT
ncbi:hypothetical protein EB796_019290 [Bugula neritina]|uniref:MADF domain-containing protein n=1 Tax=Bugula neritina TaxID=10212 RepID=A0A7J7J857_BUGNE|nr:hypothetical protein EB796_019290 [Bugula neritina]